MISEAFEESKSLIKDSTLRETRQNSDLGTPLYRPTTPGKLNKMIRNKKL